MTAVRVRDFLQFTPIDLLNGLSQGHNVLFEDGVVTYMTTKEIIVTRYFLDLVSGYENLSITSEYNVVKYYTSGMYNAKTHNKFFSMMLHDIVYKVLKPINGVTQDVLGDIYKAMYIIVQNIYSELLYNIVEYSTSMSIVDLLDIQLDKKLMDSIEKVRDVMTVESIEESYDILDGVMRNDVKHKDNPVAKAYVSGMVNANQAKQVLGPRGYVTEVDSSIFKYPIASSFTLGMRNLYDMATESRSGAKALFLSNKAIQDSEYFARELQLATMVIEDLVFTDCGNTDYIDWYVKEPEEAEGRVIYNGDLGNLVGKHFIDPDTGNYGYITKDMTHLYGKTIQIRSSLNCRLPNKHQVCSACYGELCYGVGKNDNLGHLSSVTLSKPVTQSLLSTKHLTSSANSSSVVLDDIGKRFFIVKDKNGYAFNPALMKSKDSKFKIVINQEQCYGLKDLRKGKPINTINPARTTRIEEITMLVETGDKSESFPIAIKDGSRYGYLELKFLDYVVNQGYETDDYGNYVFDMSKWKYTSPLIRLPEVEFSFFTLSKDIKSLLKTRNVLKGGVSKDTPESLLSKLFTMVNARLSVNMASLEIIVYAFVVQDLGDNNYDMGRNSPNPQLGSMKAIIDERSAGTSYAWNALIAKIQHPNIFKLDNKPASPLDVLLKPNEVMKWHYGK